MGACIYAAYAMMGRKDEDPVNKTIHVDADRIDAFVSAWESRWNRPPTRDELNGVIQRHIREEMLYRQAVNMGLDENDPVTRRRMAQKMEFLARDLSQMRDSTDEELVRYFQENGERYQNPDLISFIQVFFDPDKRDASTLEDATRTLMELQGAGEPDPETLAAGDATLMQRHFLKASEREIGRVMGSNFAEAVAQLEPGRWHGPVRSGFGVHLVYVYAVQKAAPTQLEDVKARVLGDWQEEQAEDFFEEFLENLRNDYQIVVDTLPEGRVIERPTAKENAALREESGGENGPAL